MGEFREIGSYIDRTYKVVRQDLINRFKKQGLDITPEQWVILSKLYRAKGLYQTDLANQSFRDKPTVSRIIDLLVKKEYVKRIPDEVDRRKFLITITPLGKEVVEKAQAAVDASRKLGWTDLTENEYETLISTLDKIFSNYTEKL